MTCQRSTNPAMEFSWNEMVLFSGILNGTDFLSGKQRHLLSCAAYIGIREQHCKRGLDLFASSHPDPPPPSASWPQVEWGAHKARAAKPGEVFIQNSLCRTAVICELEPIADTNWVSRGMGICSCVLVFGSQAWWKGTTQPIKFGNGSCEMLQQRDHPLWLLVIR